MRILKFISPNTISAHFTRAQTSNFCSARSETYAQTDVSAGLRKRYGRLTAALALIVPALTGVLLPSTAVAISGGASAAKPWVVQVTGYINGRHGVCSGAALNAQVIVTAAHCPLGKVIYPDGTNVDVSSYWAVTGGVDIKLLLLSQEHRLAEYPTLGAHHVSGEAAPFPPGTIGSAYGYGGYGDRKQKTLTVRLQGHSRTDTINEVLHAYEINGHTESGDSGGPLIINNKLVGIMAGQITDINGEYLQEFHGVSSTISLLRQLQHAREMRDTSLTDNTAPWIGAVSIENGRLLITMSSELVNSGRQVVIWRNGQYIGEVQNDVSYYCDKTNLNGASIISPYTVIHDGDLVQIGIMNGVNAPQASELLYERLFNGVQDVSLQDNQLNIKMSETLMNSGQRVIIWVNGAYAGEVFRGSTYYADVMHIPGSSWLTIDASKFVSANGESIQVAPSNLPANSTAASAGYDTANSNARFTVQIGVVPGSPGMSYGTPTNAQLLYGATLP